MRLWVSLSALVTTAVSIGASHRSLPQEPQTPAPPAVFRVTTALIQFDAQVADREGTPVTSLTRSDFEVLQDGVPVVLKDATFVDRRTEVARPATTPDQNRVMGVDLEPLVFLIDDMAMTLEGFQRVRRGLDDFISEGVPAGVEVGILRTGETGWRITSLTADRDLLLKQIRRMRYLARSVRRGLASGSGAAGPSGRTLDRTFVEGTLGSVTSLIANLRRLPGRKVVVLLSEGVAIDMSSVDPGTQPVQARMDRLAQLAALAGVTTHCIDVSGVRGAPSSLSVRRSLRDGLVDIAGGMGGLYLDAGNELTPALRRLAQMERGYYLLSYEPPAGTFVDTVPPPFRRLEVRVQRRGMTVRTRRGFFAGR